MKEQIIEYVRTQLSRNRARLRPYVFPNPEKEWKYPSLMGHIDIRMTARYTRSLKAEDMGYEKLSTVSY